MMTSETNEDDLERASHIGAAMLCSCRGFGYYTDPMEGGQDAYDISMEAYREIRVVYGALVAAGFEVVSRDKLGTMREASKTGLCVLSGLDKSLGSALHPMIQTDIRGAIRGFRTVLEIKDGV